LLEKAAIVGFAGETLSQGCPLVIAENMTELAVPLPSVIGKEAGVELPWRNENGSVDGLAESVPGVVMLPEPVSWKPTGQNDLPGGTSTGGVPIGSHRNC
jgi:hypothetical protein